jgi:hypothetical protein
MSDSNKAKPFSVHMDSTCSGAWAVIGENCVDPESGEEWFHELAMTGTTHVEKRRRNGQPVSGPIGTIHTHPERFELTEDGAELVALANLFAAAPVLLSDLKAAAQLLREYEAHHRAKNTEDSLTKADVNAQMAARFEAAIGLAESIRC